MTRRQQVLSSLVALGVLLSAGASPASEPQDYLVKVGVMEPVDARTDRLRETRTLTMDPDRRPGFCFLVHPPTSDPYDVYSIHHLPHAPDSLTGVFKNKEPARAPKGIRTPTERGDGIRPFCFDFDPGDPLGKYRIEVFINGALKATLLLDVVAPAPPTQPD